MLKMIQLMTAVMLSVFSGADVTTQTLPEQSALLVEEINSDPAMKAWVDATYDKLSPKQRVAQLFVPHLVIGDNQAGRAVVKRMVYDEHVGGILLSKGTTESYVNLINYAQSLADVPLLVTLDGEWGPAMRVSDAPRYPYNMGLGAITDRNLLYDYGRQVARECRALGVQVDFAPVLDVNTNPANPVIGQRSYGADAEAVARLGVAFSVGLESGGVMSVAKHFPGHGDTSTDSHKTLPTVGHSLSRLTEVDLLPFDRYIRSNLSGIMVGHLNVPAIDPSGTPASLSKAVVSDLLCGQMGFTGLVFTDALEMKGASVPGVNNCVAALNAGADVLLGSARPADDIDAVLSAAKSDKHLATKVEQACRKVLAYKYRLGLSVKPAPASVSAAKAVFNSAEAQSVMRRLAAASITVIRDKDALLPLDSLESRAVNVVLVNPGKDRYFSNMLENYADVSEFIVSADRPLNTNGIDELRKGDINIVAIFDASASSLAAWKSLENLPGLIPVFFVNPYKMAKFGDLSRRAVLVTAYDDTPALRVAAAQALFGGIAVSGRFPVGLDKVAPLGSGVSYSKCRLGFAEPVSVGFDDALTSRLDSIAREAVEAKAFPGCQVLVAKDGWIVYDKAFGKLDYADGAPATPSTIYDIASMSKAVGTLSGLMKAYDEGLYKISDKVSVYIPALQQSADKRDITIGQLLYHQSGMPAALNMYPVMFDPDSYTGPLTRATRTEQYPYRIQNKLWGNKNARLRKDIVSDRETDLFPFQAAKGIYVGDAAYDTIMNRIYNVPVKTPVYRYSCLNFALLMDMEQRVTGVGHDQWVDTEVFGPLGAWRTLYRPLERFDASEIAPTEKDEFLRKQHLRGTVHDEMAAFSGGVQGNAGLFSTAVDVAKLCQMWLNGGIYGRNRILSAETVRLFTQSKSPTAERGLGFDLVTNLKSLADSGAPASTYGHTGFTGTCFWVDPENNIIFVFLSNRVNPSRVNAAYTRLQPRAEMLKAIYSSM